uniref:Widely interspaced zinc finger motifs n=1 Tax=Xenopus tropicalis TaxID=8364 RepID=A0A803KA01_XENTR
MEEVHSSYLSGHEDLDNMPFPQPSMGQNEACSSMPCPGGVEIVLVGGGKPAVGVFPEESRVRTSFSCLELEEDHREGMRLTHSMEPDGMACGLLGCPEQDHHTTTLTSPKFSLTPDDSRSLHQMNTHPPSNLASPWGFTAADPQDEGESGAVDVSSDGQYVQDRGFEWTSGLEDEAEDQSDHMMVRSEPTPITMPVFRRALQLGGMPGSWQVDSYSEEEAQVEVEEEEEEEEGSVYTCIECSIYFKKKTHLLEHMFQHSQDGEGDGSQAGEGSHACSECGKGFVDEGSLAAHRHLHQESRQKIIEEISKLENFADEGRGARLQCPKCLFGTNSSKVFVQHAKSHVKKGTNDGRGGPTPIRTQVDTVEGGESSEQMNDETWKNSEAGSDTGQGWSEDMPQGSMSFLGQGLGKAKKKTSSSWGLKSGLWREAECHKPSKSSKLPEAAVVLKRQYRTALRAGGGGREGERRQLREEVAIVVLENISPFRKKGKGHRAWGYGKRLSGGSERTQLHSNEHRLPKDSWAEDGEESIPLDVLLMDPNYEGQLEALGLRSEERECPYCPDRFHNGIGLANHVRGHLNRVGVSYNVRHFISAEEVKAIEQNYSFQKKRKKVANFDPSTFSLMRCEFCGAGFDTRAGLSSHARAHLRDFGITNWELTVSPIHVLARLLARSPGRPLPQFSSWHQDDDTDVLGSEEEDGDSLDLIRSQTLKPDSGHVLEKMPSEQSAGRAEDAKGPSQTTCEVCGACFETRKGLSSHARSHLRHLGVAESESSGAPIDLLYELAKQGKLPQDESLLGAKKSGSPRTGSPRGQWGDEDGPLNLTLDGESGKETDCQFCGAWFETRKGLSSHARAHLRHLGVNDPDAKGSPIAALNSLIKSEEFKKRLSSQGTSEKDSLTKTAEESTSTEAAMSTSPASSGAARAKLTDNGTFTKIADGMVKGADDPSTTPESISHSLNAEGSGMMAANSGSLETSPFKSPSGTSAGTHANISNAGSPHSMAPDAGVHQKMAEPLHAQVKTEAGRPQGKMAEAGRPQGKMAEAGRPHGRMAEAGRPHGRMAEAGRPHGRMAEAGRPHGRMAEAGRPHGKMAEAGRPHGRMVEAGRPQGAQSKSSLAGLTHARPSVGGTPSAKKLKMSAACKASSEAFWSPNSSPLNLSPGSEEVRCEFCGEFFENRKGLSSHARSHLRQMGVTEWHVNGSPIDTLREILARGTFPRAGNRVGGPSSEKLLALSPPSPSSPSRPLPYSGLSPAMHRKPPRLPTYTHDWSSELSPLNLSARADPSRDIRCEFCNEFFENRKGLSSHARSHLRQMGVTEWHVNGSPIDTLREIIRKRGLPPLPHVTNIKKEPRTNDELTSPSHTLSPLSLGPSSMAREHPVSPLTGRPPNTFLSPMSPKRPASHEPRLSHSEPKSYVHLEPKPSNQAQGKVYLSGEGRPKLYIQEDNRPKSYLQSEGRPKAYLQSEGRPKMFLQSEGRAKAYVQGEGRPKQFLPGEAKARTYNKAYLHGEGKPKTFMHGEGKFKAYLHNESKPKPYLHGEGKLKAFVHADGKPKPYLQGDGKPKAYIQTELPFKVKVKASPDKTPTTLEACCELCGLYFENRKALASHARAHLRQFGVTEWCVNGSPIETLREWMKQRPQKAGAYLSYIQGGRPFSKKFKRSNQMPKAGAMEGPVTPSAKMSEAERNHGTPSVATEKPADGQMQKTERRQSKPPEVPPSREDAVSEHLPKTEETRPPPRPRPVPSLVPRPPQTSLVKFVGNIYTLKCRFCDIQFQGPLSIQEQWVRHLQHHILEMNFSKPLNSPVVTSPAQAEPATAAQ